MPFEPKDLIAIPPMLLSAYALYLSKQRDRQGIDKERWQKIDAEMAALRQREQANREAFIELKAKVDPFVSGLASMVVDMFHKPSDEYGLDHMIQRFGSDKSDAKWSISEEELDRLLQHIEMQYQNLKREGTEANPAEQLKAMIGIVSLRSILELRKAIRQRELRDADDEAKRGQLAAYLEQAKQWSQDRESLWIRAWTSLRKYLGGSN